MNAHTSCKCSATLGQCVMYVSRWCTCTQCTLSSLVGETSNACEHQHEASEFLVHTHSLCAKLLDASFIFHPRQNRINLKWNGIKMKVERDVKEKVIRSAPHATHNTNGFSFAQRFLWLGWPESPVYLLLFEYYKILSLDDFTFIADFVGVL